MNRGHSDMSVEIIWDNEEKTILRFIFDRRWSWQEFFEAKAAAYTLIGTVNHPVGIILHGPPETNLPPNALSHSRNALRNTHPNTRIVVFVLTSAFFRTMIGIVVKIAPNPTDL